MSTNLTLPKFNITQPHHTSHILTQPPVPNISEEYLKNTWSILEAYSPNLTWPNPTSSNLNKKKKKILPETLFLELL